MDDSFCDAATKPATSTTDEIGSATCGWSAWSGWGVCSVGTQTETRTCNPLALNHCTPNPNGTSETQSCGTPASVTAWSTCSG